MGKWRNFITPLMVVLLLFWGGAAFAIDTTDSEWVGGDKRWEIEDGHLLPLTDSTYNIGASGTEVLNVFTDTLTLGGVAITGVSQLSSPWEDQGAYSDLVDGGDNVKVYENGNVTIVGTIDADGMTMENDATFTNATNNYVKLCENSDTLSWYFDGTDVTVDNDGGGYTLKLSTATTGTFDIYTLGVTSDYFSIYQGTNQATISALGTDNDLYLVAAGGDINCGDENITTTGTLSVGTFNTDTITGTTNTDVLNLGAAVDDSLRWAPNDEAAVISLYSYEGKTASFEWMADEGDEAGDTWRLTAADSITGTLSLTNDSAVDNTQATVWAWAAAGDVTMEGDRITFGDDEYIDNGTDDTIKLSSNDGNLEVLLYSPNATDGTVTISLAGDAAGAVNGEWNIINDPSADVLYFKSDSATIGTMVTKLTIASADGDITTTGDIEVLDDMDLVIGTNGDVKIQYDEAGDDQLLIQTFDVGAAATTDPLVEILVPASPTADQDVFSVAKGDTQASVTQLFVVDEDGDVDVTNNFTAGGTAVITGKITGNGDALLAGTTPLLTIGDGGDEDAGITFDGAGDFYISNENTTDDLQIGVGAAVGTDPRISIVDSATHSIVMFGDGVTSMDNTLLLDGNALDFRISLDDSADDLEIGVNGVVETDERITIDGDANNTYIYFGDGADGYDQMLVFDGGDSGGDDYYMGIDDTDDDFKIGLGAAMATTTALIIDDTNYNVAVQTDLSVLGGDVTISTATASKPAINITSDVVAATSSVTTYTHTRGGVDAVDGDDIHTDIYASYDDGTPTAETYVSVLYDITDSDVSGTDGSVAWTVVSGGSDFEYLALDGVGGIEFNAGSEDINLHVDTDTTADFFLIDAGTDVLTVSPMATGKILLSGATTRTGTTEVLDINATIDTTTATDDVPTMTIVTGRASGDTGGTYGIKTDITVGNMANGEWSYAYGGSYVATAAATATSNAATFYAYAPTASATCNDYGVYIAAGYDTELYVGDDATIVDNLTAGDLAISEAAGVLSFTGATSATISTSTGTCDIVLDSADDAANSAKTYVSITGTIPAHASGTPTDIFLDITPTLGINTGAANVHMIDLTYTTPAWATAVTSNNRAIYIAPTIGDASAGTNAANMVEIAAITGDASVTVNGILIGALTGTGAAENAINIGAGWDAGILTTSPVTLGTSSVAANLAMHDASTLTMYEDGDSFSASMQCKDGAAEFLFNDDVNIGGSADAENLKIHNAGIQYWYEGGDTFEVHMACNDGEAVATLTGGLDITGAVQITGTTTTAGIITPPIAVTDAGTYSVLAANSGKVHYIPDLTQDCVLSLPTASAGLYYKFVYAGVAEDAHDWTFDTGADANYFLGGCTDFDDDDGTFGVVYPDGDSNSKVKIDTPNAGTSVELWCNGTHWILNGQIVSGTDTATAFSDQA
jgi:hypothetical protein